MKKVSVRFKITLIAVLAISTAILCIFIASYPSFRSETDRGSVETMNLIGKMTKDTLDDYFLEVEQSIRLVAGIAIDSLDSVTLVEYGLAGAYAAEHERTQEQTLLLDEYIAEHCEFVKKGVASIANHISGVTAFYYCIDPKVSRTARGFFYSRIGKVGFIAQELPNSPFLDEERICENPWYREPVQHGVPCWSGPYDSSYVDGQQLCSYSMPIYCGGVLVGILGVDIPLQIMIDQVRPIRLYETGFASLCDKNGQVIYHPEKEMGALSEINELPYHEELLAQDNSGRAMIRYRVDHETRQMSFLTLINGMKLILSVPMKEINSFWLRIIHTIIPVTIVVILLSAFALMLIMRIITEPLHLLTLASQRLADADYDVELDYSSQDEIGTLTDAFQRMRNQLKGYIGDLNRLAYSDVLTQLPNMRHFFILAEEEYRSLLEKGQEPSILFFDLVGMKYYNRQYGFEEGDRILCCFGQVLREEFSEKRVCRFSEDHFVAITDQKEAVACVERLFARCNADPKDHPLPVHVGISPWRREEVSISVACDRAKYACERHRGSYLSAWYPFDETMVQELEEVHYIIDHLEQALREHWVQVYYQPIICAGSGLISDAEALSRWIDPERGMIVPGVFIPILEKARLIYRVDLYVVDQVLQKMKCQQELGMKVVPHSINLSRADFDSCDIVEEIRRRVDEAGISRDMFSIEVTESIIGSDMDFMKGEIRRFHDLGFKVWMDDFGSGYSSLDVLQELSFDLIKFDMKFLQNFDKGEKGKTILSDLLYMVRDLDMVSLCEGVESAEMIDFLQRNGCCKLQGFFYSRPVPFETIQKCHKDGLPPRKEDCT